MDLKRNIISLAVAILSLAIICNANSSTEYESSLSVLNLMARSIDLIQRNPTRSEECFNYYIPLVGKIFKTYRANYEACKQTSNSKRLDAEAATLSKRNYLAFRANNSCTLLSQCTEMATAVNNFECFINGSSVNDKTMYDIKNNASDYLAELQEQLRLIEYQEIKCTNDSKRTCESEFAYAYEDFNKCIKGISVVPISTEGPRTSENPEGFESSESTPSEEILPDAKLPEEDISFLSLLKSRIKYLRSLNGKQ